MQPIGLSFKPDGELKIVHACLSCGRKSNNRIAGDDLPDAILSLIQHKSSDKHLITAECKHEVITALFGNIHGDDDSCTSLGPHTSQTATGMITTSDTRNKNVS